MTLDSISENIRANNKTWLIVIVKILIAAGILYYLVSNINYNEIIKAIDEANLILLGVAFALSFVNIYLQFIKWKLTCKTILHESKTSRIFTSLFYGLSAGAITPVRVGEYFGRAIAFKNKPLIQVTIATLLDKFFPLLVVAFSGSISAIFFIYLYYDVSIYLVFSLFIVVFTLFYMLEVILRSENFWNGILYTRLNNKKYLGKFFLQIQSVRKIDRKYFTSMTIISLLFYFCYLLQYALLVASFSHHSEMLNYLWAGNLIMFVKTVIPPISLGELGIREGASVFFLTKFNELSSVAFNASIFLFIINILLPALFGLILLTKKNDD